MKGWSHIHLRPPKWLAFMLILALALGSAQAANTGKIKARVIDAKSGEAIIGANVIVLASQPRRGAASDLNGYVLIPQVPVGTYDVQVTAIGYNNTKVTGVTVGGDQTVELGTIKLAVSSLKGEEIVVRAEKNKIQLDKPGQTLSVSAEKIERSSVSDATNLVAKMPGFKVDDEGALHARGGRAEETKFVVNGIDARDPLVGGQSFVNVDMATIENLDVLSGGFGPEYGQAQAAVIKVSTKEGDASDYHGKVEWTTDQPFDKFSFNSDQLTFNWGGPLPFQTGMEKSNRSTFFFSGRAYLTDTYLPFNVDRGSWNYTNLGLDLPERQKNEYQASLNLAFPLTPTSKLKLFGERYYRRWDLYPEGEGAASGNYGYGYLFNVRNRPRAETNKNSLSLTYTNALSTASSFETVFYRSETRTLITPGKREPDDFMLEFSAQERAQEDDKSAFLGYQDLDGNGYFDGYVDANNNGAYDGFTYDSNGNPVYSEGYEDVNRNGRWDRGEDWVDLNGDGQYDSAEPFVNIPDPASGINNPTYDPWDPFTDMNGNGRWDDAEPQTPEQDTNHNGSWDGERFQDVNNDGNWNGWHETFTDANNNGSWDDGETFVDGDSDGLFDSAEGYDDINADGRINFKDVRDDDEDLGEPYVDGDLFADTGEPFIDEPDAITGAYNGMWDAGEVYFDLPSTEGGYSRWLSNGANGTPPEAGLNGHYDGPNWIFDEYELFTRFADFMTDPFSAYHQQFSNIRDIAETPEELIENAHFRGSVVDVSRPVVYQNFDLNVHGSDWPTGKALYLSGLAGSSWIDRSSSPELEIAMGGAYIDPPNRQWDEWEPFTDYNANGKQDGGNAGNTALLADWGYSYNQPGYYDFFLNPETFDTQALWQERKSITYSLKTEYQTQLNQYHDALAGLEMMYRDMEMQSIEEPQIPYDGLIALPPGSPYPDRGNFRDFYHRKPLEGALYMRDKMEFEGLNVLIGLRYDFLVHESSFVSETRDNANAGNPGAIEANPTTGRFSPRLGISHPITDQAKLYFNYGHFYQAPSYQYFYREATGARANSIIVGNPNLKYEKTVEYQFGVEARFPDLGTTVNVQGYYRDIFDQVTSTSVEVAPGYTIDMFTNGDYGRSRGVNLSVEKAAAHSSVSFNYELSFAYGKASAAREAAEARVAGVPVNREEHPLDWDQTHSINTYWSLYYDDGEFPELFGVRLPDDWLLTISNTYGSGQPYTPSRYTQHVDNDAKIDINSERMPWTEDTDLKFEKYFRLGAQKRHQFVTGFEIRNIFNKRNVRSIYSATGTTYLAMHPSDPNYAIYYPNKAMYDANPRMFSEGRNMLLRFGYKF